MPASRVPFGYSHSFLHRVQLHYEPRRRVWTDGLVAESLHQFIYAYYDKKPSLVGSDFHIGKIQALRVERCFVSLLVR